MKRTEPVFPKTSDTSPARRVSTRGLSATRHRILRAVPARAPIADGFGNMCHLGIDIDGNGVKIDGIPFMKQRQAPLG